MSPFKTGAAWCFEKGLHRWVRLSAAVEWCSDCGRARSLLFTDEQIDRFEAADANRAEQEAEDRCSDNERDLRNHAEER